MANTLRDPTDRLFNQFSKDQFDVASREILLNAESGISTIIGVLDDSELFKGYPKPNARVTTVLVYCSFQSLSDRVAARNNTALESGRYEELGNTPLFDLPTFRPKTEQDDPKAIVEELDRKTVVDAFNLHFDAMKKEKLRVENKEKFSREEKKI